MLVLADSEWCVGSGSFMMALTLDSEVDMYRVDFV